MLVTPSPARDGLRLGTAKGTSEDVTVLSCGCLLSLADELIKLKDSEGKARRSLFPQQPRH